MSVKLHAACRRSGTASTSIGRITRPHEKAPRSGVLRRQLRTRRRAAAGCAPSSSAQARLHEPVEAARVVLVARHDDDFAAERIGRRRRDHDVLGLDALRGDAVARTSARAAALAADHATHIHGRDGDARPAPRVRERPAARRATTSAPRRARRHRRARAAADVRGTSPRVRENQHRTPAQKTRSNARARAGSSRTSGTQRRRATSQSHGSMTNSASP